MIAILGKSGSGKNSALNELVKMGYERVVPFTTRPMRPDETHGIDYWFVDDDQFQDLQNAGAFAASNSFTTTQGVWWYGFTWNQCRQEDAAGIINPGILKELRKHDIKMVSFYLDISDSVRKCRLKLRGDDSTEILRRMNADQKDFAGVDQYVHKVINDQNGAFSPKAIAVFISAVYKSYKGRE